jgi:hypothetical protein
MQKQSMSMLTDRAEVELIGLMPTNTFRTLWLMPMLRLSRLKFVLLRVHTSLTATAVESDDGRCLLKIELKEESLANTEEVTASKIKVNFTGIDQPGMVRVMVLPGARNEI